MDFTGWINWAYQALHVDSWGLTPVSLVAPASLLALMFLVRRFRQASGPRYDKRDLGGAALITVIIVAGFLWIFAGIGLLHHYG